MVSFAELLMMLGFQPIVRNTTPIACSPKRNHVHPTSKNYFNYLLFSNVIEHEIAINTTYVRN